MEFIDYIILYVIISNQAHNNTNSADAKSRAAD